MARISTTAWIAEKQVTASMRLEPLLVILALALASWVFYKIFLRKVSYERHRMFKDFFRNLMGHVVFGVTLFGFYEFLAFLGDTEGWARRIAVYVGMITIVWGCITVVKTLRIMAFEYLFLMSMKSLVPMLLVNIFTLILSLVAFVWILTFVFEVNLMPLLATSAVFSIVLGLALQDTLGNLFAGIALQFDKPFELGDWTEVKLGSDKAAGQVVEISWRATVLLAITDELITIPNRTMAQGNISNFAGRQRPFVRSHIFRIPHEADAELAKEALLSAIHPVPGISQNPPPVVVITESAESWLTLKLVYNIRDYGSQYSIADRVISLSMQALQEAGIQVATPRLKVDRSA